MPHDIVTPPISSSITRQDRGPATLPRVDRPAEASQAQLFAAMAAPEFSRPQTPPAGSSAAFLAQTLAQADTSTPRGSAFLPPGKAASIAQRYELAESHDAILRGGPILFRVRA
jgi:hypothetical protein